MSAARRLNRFSVPRKIAKRLAALEGSLLMVGDAAVGNKTAAVQRQDFLEEVKERGVPVVASLHDKQAAHLYFVSFGTTTEIPIGTMVVSVAECWSIIEEAEKQRFLLNHIGLKKTKFALPLEDIRLAAYTNHPANVARAEAALSLYQKWEVHLEGLLDSSFVSLLERELLFSVSVDPKRQLEEIRQARDVLRGSGAKDECQWWRFAIQEVSIEGTSFSKENIRAEPAASAIHAPPVEAVKPVQQLKPKVKSMPLKKYYPYERPATARRIVGDYRFRTPYPQCYGDWEPSPPRTLIPMTKEEAMQLFRNTTPPNTIFSPKRVGVAPDFVAKPTWFTDILQGKRPATDISVILGAVVFKGMNAYFDDGVENDERDEAEGKMSPAKYHMVQMDFIRSRRAQMKGKGKERELEVDEEAKGIERKMQAGAKGKEKDWELKTELKGKGEEREMD